MTQISIIGNFLGISGYDSHTRGLATALSKIADVRLSTTIQPGQEGLLTDKELEIIKKEDKKEINLIITSPLFWRIHLNAKRNWVFIIFEGTKLPRHFIEEMLNEDIEKIFSPSEHTKQAILNTVDSLSEEECKKLMEKLE